MSHLTSPHYHEARRRADLHAMAVTPFARYVHRQLFIAALKAMIAEKGKG